jgi:molecular chaperone DnaK
MTVNPVATPARKQPPVGIDLGTTYSLVAYLDATGRPTTVPNGWGDLLTPSAIFCDSDDVLVGKEAVKNAALAPDLYAECFKRDMGGLLYRHKLRNVDVPPEVLSALVLDRLRKDAEQRLGPIREVVITVPAFFDETRRKATQDAGQLAGLTVLDIINEPTAAAVAYGYQRGLLQSGPQPSSAQRVLVYDLGGGTFDVTILEIEGTRFRAVATDGDVLLGGKDFDQRLVDHLAERFLAAQGVDPRSDPQDAVQLWFDAQEAKHSLSERSKTSVLCFHAGIRMRIEVTRSELEELTRDLVERTETTTSLLVKQAGLDWGQIDRVLLVGGSSRMPMVRDMLRRLSGKEPDCSQSPDEAVAQGAALYAGMLSRQHSTPGKPSYELLNVSSHSLGVVGMHQQTKEKINVVLIPKNTQLPRQAVRKFKTARADQRSVCVSVVEGESHRPEDCIALGKCVVRDLPPGLPQGTPIEVEYAYAANGRISVLARIPTVRQSARVEIKRNQARQLEDLETWRRRLVGVATMRHESDACDAAAADLNDRASVVQHLDMRYTRLGKRAAGLVLPTSLARSQAAAVQATAECARLEQGCRDAANARQPAISRTEVIRLDALLAQTKTELHEAQVVADFAHLVLGRECASSGFCPPGGEADFQEIRQLQQHLGG